MEALYTGHKIIANKGLVLEAGSKTLVVKFSQVGALAESIRKKLNNPDRAPQECIGIKGMNHLTILIDPETALRLLDATQRMQSEPPQEAQRARGKGMARMVKFG